MILLTGSTALAALAIAACSGTGVEPRFRGPISGAYELLTVAGSPLPYLWDASTTYADHEIADTLILDGRGGGANVDVVERDFVNGAAPVRHRGLGDVHYVVRGDTLVFIPTCPLGEACAASVPVTGWFRPDGTLLVGVVAADGTMYPQTTRRYRRIAWPLFQHGAP